MSQVPSWIWKTLVGVGTVAAVVVSLFSIQKFFDDKLQQEFATQSRIIVEEIQSKSEILIDFHKADVWDRIQVMQLEIERREQAEEAVPDSMKMHLRSMQERYDEMKDPWDD